MGVFNKTKKKMITKIETSDTGRRWNVSSSTSLMVHVDSLPTETVSCRLSFRYDTTNFNVELPEDPWGGSTIYGSRHISPSSFSDDGEGGYSASISWSYFIPRPEVFLGKDTSVVPILTTTSSDSNFNDLAVEASNILVNESSPFTEFHKITKTDGTTLYRFQFRSPPLEDLSFDVLESNLYTLSASSVILYTDNRELELTATPNYPNQINISGTPLTNPFSFVQTSDYGIPSTFTWDDVFASGGGNISSDIVTTNVDEYFGPIPFEISLNEEMYQDEIVTVSVSSSNTNAFEIDNSELTFDKSNWNIPQQFSISPVPDGVYSRNVSTSWISVSESSGSYSLTGGSLFTFSNGNPPEIEEAGTTSLRSKRIQADGFVQVPENEHWIVVRASGEGQYKVHENSSYNNISTSTGSTLYLPSGSYVRCDDYSIDGRLEITYFINK